MIKSLEVITIQLRVFDNLLASAWMQYATSARGRITEVAQKIPMKTKKAPKYIPCKNEK